MIGSEHSLRVGDQVEFQGQQVRVTCVESSIVHFDQNLVLRSDDMKIVQAACTAQPREMHALLRSAWAKLFNREPADITEQQWGPALQKIQELEEHAPFERHEITAQQLKDAMTTTKKASARGAEGFTTKDLCKMPLQLWQLVATILNLIENGAPWPRAWVLARTLCWPKASETRQALDIRPITILEKIYRVWAKVRGKQITMHLAGQVPNIIGGPCKGISSEYIAMYTAERVEQALEQNQPLQGLALDIIKCYNAVPRTPLYALLRRLGVPQPIVQAFSCAMQSIERFFVIAGTCSPTFATTTGIAEGCSIAVPSMLALSILADRAIKKTNETTETAMFADNWALFDLQTQPLVDAFTSLKQLLDALKLEIAGKKSWFWATHPQNCSRLKQIAKTTGIPVVLHTKDLGIQQNYGRRLYKETTQKKS